MRVLVLGSGAREHSIVEALLREHDPRGNRAHEIVVAPGNAGIATAVQTADIEPTNPEQVVALAQEFGAELVVVGPEAPLVAGVADALRERGIAVFGPDKAAADLEGSKAFAKDVMTAAGVPTGAATRAATLGEAEEALGSLGAPYVVKADGLASGKGVLVTHSRSDALSHAENWLAHGPVLIEEFLSGPEISLFFVTDGQTVLPLTPAQDFKRLLNDDEGPNTGGMGAYSPLPWLEPVYGSEENFAEHVRQTIAQPTIDELSRRGHPFVGLLYCGLIVTDKGVKVIEFNARFGDPETQVVLRRLTSPLSELLYSAAIGTLASTPAPSFTPDAAVTVVLASQGYPEAPQTGRSITGLDEAAAVEDVTISHAATQHVGDELLASGGRVLSVIATGATIEDARARVYSALDHISLPGAHYRTDIAAHAHEIELSGEGGGQ